MIQVENIAVYNIARAVYSARNPMNSWEKSDSDLEHDILGEKDIDLANRLYNGGPEHRKFMRQIFVTMDVVCHHTWWAEFDTYKVGVTRDSCSKMHTIHVKSFEPDDFSHEGIDEVGNWSLAHFYQTLDILEHLRKLFNETGEKKYWRAMIELLPMGYNLRATVTMNYENAVNMIRQRSTHKLDEWIEFTEILKSLPYMEEITKGKYGRDC